MQGLDTNASVYASGRTGNSFKNIRGSLGISKNIGGYIRHTGGTLGIMKLRGVV